MKALRGKLPGNFDPPAAPQQAVNALAAGFAWIEKFDFYRIIAQENND
ncbi:MAG: hypothetical protein PHQ63_07030 [Smithellaceae bacterium]|jgi:hypothetical protein|nr:hypothetical protein [Smithellaceae bacterium]